MGISKKLMASQEDTFKDINPLLAAFEVGLCVNKLGWHQAQALVTEDSAHKNGVVEELARIAGFLIPLDPNNRGGSLRDAISLSTEGWQKIFSDEWYAEFEACRSRQEQLAATTELHARGAGTTSPSRADEQTLGIVDAPQDVDRQGSSVSQWQDTAKRAEVIA